MKNSVQRGFSYLLANKGGLGIARELDTSDFHVEAIDLLGNGVDAEVGVAFSCVLLDTQASSCPPCPPGVGRHEHPRQYSLRHDP